MMTWWRLRRHYAPLEETNRAIKNDPDFHIAENVLGWRVSSKGHDSRAVRLLLCDKSIHAKNVLQHTICMKVSVDVDGQWCLADFVFEGILPPNETTDEF
jgi:hypothetical protein